MADHCILYQGHGCRTGVSVPVVSLVDSSYYAIVKCSMIISAMVVE